MSSEYHNFNLIKFVTQLILYIIILGAWEEQRVVTSRVVGFYKYSKKKTYLLLCLSQKKNAPSYK